MAARIGNDGTQYNGLEVVRSRPRTFIVEPDLEDIASDLAYSYQMLKGLDLEGSALTNITPQAHDGVTGAKLGWPLASVQIGDGQAAVLLENKGLAVPEIRCGAISTEPRRYCWTLPVFVPNGHDLIVVRIRATSAFWTLFPTVGLLSPIDWSLIGSEVQVLTNAPASAAAGDDEQDFYFFVPVADDGAVNILRLYLHDCVNNSTTHKLLRGLVLPFVWTMSTAMPPDGVASSSGALTQPLRGGAWNKLWDTLTAAGRPLCSALLGEIAENLGMLFELTTGSPAPGYTAVDTDGHNHDGANSAVIDMALLSLGLGWAPVSSINGLGPSEGFFGAAPSIVDDETDTSWWEMCHAPVQMPVRSSALTVNWAACIYDQDGDGTSTRVITSSAPGGTDATSSTQTTSGAGWKLVSGTVGATHSDVNWCRFEIANNYDKGPGEPHLMSMTGVALWVTA